LLDVGFGRGPAVQPRIEVDIGQILALPGREGFCRRTWPSTSFEMIGGDSMATLFSPWRPSHMQNFTARTVDHIHTLCVRSIYALPSFREGDHRRSYQLAKNSLKRFQLAHSTLTIFAVERQPA
jgi:hypothetical protein